MANISKKIKSIDTQTQNHASGSSLGLKPIITPDEPPATHQAADTKHKKPDSSKTPPHKTEPHKTEPNEIKAHKTKPNKKHTHPAPSTSEPASAATRANIKEKDEKTGFGWMRFLIWLSAFLWIICAASAVYGYFILGLDRLNLSPVHALSLVLLIIMPAIMIFTAGHALKQLGMLSAQSQGLKAVSDELLRVDATVPERAQTMSHQISQEIDRLNAKVDVTLSRLDGLSESVTAHVTNLVGTQEKAKQQTDDIAMVLQNQRDGLEAIAHTFDERMSNLSTALSEHAQTLMQTTELTEQKAQEARVRVEDVATRLNTTTDHLRNNTMEAADSLEKNQNELDRLIAQIQTRTDELDRMYQTHAQKLSGMIAQLKDEQNSLGSTLEARLEKMRDMSLSAQVSAETLVKASEAGQKTVAALAEAARFTDSAVKQRFSEMEELVEYSNARAETISDKAARRVRDSLSQTRKEISRIENDMATLQARLHAPKTPAQNTPSQANPAQNTPTNEAKKPQKRGLLGLKPLDTFFADTRTSAAVSTKKSLLSIRPAPDADDEPLASQTPKTQTPKTQTSVSPSPTDQGHAHIEQSTASVSHHQDKAEKALDQADLDHSLDYHPVNIEDDLKFPHPDEHLLTYDPQIDNPKPAPHMAESVTPSHNMPQILRQTQIDSQNDLGARPGYAQGKAEKSRWRLRDMLSRNKTNSAHISNVTPSMPAEESQIHNSDTGEIATQRPDQIASHAHSLIDLLTSRGMAPAALVDDGCIIEATNARRSHGVNAMREVVLRRLGEPINHLRNIIDSDPTFTDALYKDHLTLHQKIEHVANDREAIRAILERDSGRAYLLCDTALNLRH